MPAAKKFGAFGGVFTPAILTILGVIMYMRLPWIVGQAGLYSAIGIILVAHIISITTGLSVSSISTDKKVKTGGTYYMISRSLGLPIGGTLGLALFVGLSFSVSLYLIGFSESFLGFWGIEVTKNTIRICGSVALLVVTVVTFVSTSFALKTQFFILMAIILSLVSILSGNPEAAQQTPHLTPVMGAAPFIVLFGIFFPAVTGFEAGVSMSGDLQNPKKSIPAGTISAIVVGLVVYIGMAVFFSYRVDPEQLVNNPNVLLDIALFPQLVLAGIWGATLSSALGSILGAPRILQAISTDKITPRFFGVGYGKENEPRNALLLTFVIAEVGILVGELDVIARVVSMFFITTYGFLNLSCALENWASPDFRPEFRVWKIVSLLGSLTCLIVMIQLDLIAMIGATVLLLLLFFYLKRKELTLESGDTWEGVWSSIIRSGLDYLNKGNLQQRNWRPNIILFSGDSSIRPHLLSLGSHLVDKRGLLSNFDLVEVEDAKAKQRKPEQAVLNDNDAVRGIYARRVETGNVYETMETITRYYGFSGLEPNTVLMGWGRSSRNPEKLVHIIQTIVTLDYNLMLLSFDKEKGFGKFRQIDIWWGGLGNMISFAASLCRFLTGADEWRDSRVRFLMITDQTSLVERYHQVLNQVIDDFRIDAVVKVINNAVEKKPFYEIIRTESGEADLIINGIPDIPAGEENLYVEKTNAVINSLGTVLLIRASSFFEDRYSSVAMDSMVSATEIRETGHENRSTAFHTSLPEGPASSIRRFKSLMNTVNQHLEKEYLPKLQLTIEQPAEIFRKVVTNATETIREQFPDNERFKNQKLVSRIQGDLLFQLQKRYSDLLKESGNFRKAILEETNQWVINHVDSIPAGLQEVLKIPRSDRQLKPESTDSLTIRAQKLIKRLNRRITQKPVESEVKFRTLVSFILMTSFRGKWLDFMSGYVFRSLQVYSDLQRDVDKVVDSLGMIQQSLKNEEGLPTEKVLLEMDEIQKRCDLLSQANERLRLSAATGVAKLTTEILELLEKDLKRFDSQLRLRTEQPSKKAKRLLLGMIEEIPEIWSVNHTVMMKTVVADILVLTLKNRIMTIVSGVVGEFLTEVDQKLLNEMGGLSRLQEKLVSGDISTKEFKNSTSALFRHSLSISADWLQLTDEIRAIVNDLPESVESVLQDSLQSVSEQLPAPLGMVEIPLRRKVEYFIESTFLGPVEDELMRISAELNKIGNAGLDIVRLLSVGLSDDEAPQDNGLSASESLERIIGDSSERLVELKKRALVLREELEQTIQHSLKNTLESIHLFSLTSSQDDSVSSMKTKRQVWLLRRINSHWRTFTAKVSDISTHLLYRQTSMTESDEQERTFAAPESKVDRLLEFIESVTPYPETVSALPFYYKHLFLGKPVITKEFWVGRSAELQKAAKAVKRFKEGVPCGLAVIGEPGSGKSALSQMIASRHFERSKIWTLNAPEASTADPNQFDSKLRRILGLSATDSPMRYHWPKNSVLVVDDMGAWWQRRDGGLAVIGRLQELIRTIGNQCLVIINCNLATYLLIDRLTEMDPFLLDVITCGPMDAKSLKEIVTVRHHSTGLTFQYRQQNEADMNAWTEARFFTKCFRSSNGNIGLALKNWIRTIDSVSKEHIAMEFPPKPKTDLLQSLDNDQWILLSQLVLHSGLSRLSLAEIMRTEADDLDNDLRILLEAGMILMNQNQVMTPNPFALDYVHGQLQQKGLI